MFSHVRNMLKEENVKKMYFAVEDAATASCHVLKLPVTREIGLTNTVTIY